ncbi:MAG: tungstate ABC transporter substrate-binding protein WtpA [Syntrophotaleaceae bacterium]
MYRCLSFICFLLLIGFLFPGSLLAEPAGKLIIFHAGSLTVPFAEMEKEFEARFPKVDIQREMGGSTRIARLISEVGKPADLMAAADYQVIDKSLIPSHARINIRFATNEVVLAYNDRSRHASEFSSDTWYDILGRKGVVWGHSDPNVDPGGYRALMAMQLAEKYYRRPGLYEKLLANRPKQNLRDKAVSLTSLLQNGEMDYIWTYRSLALQHNLKFISIDEHLNLAVPENNSFYRQATVRVTGEKPGTYLDRIGEYCAYGIALLENAPNREAAEAFLAYLIDPQGGLAILDKHGQPPFIPAWVPTQEMKNLLPASLQKMVVVR